MVQHGHVKKICFSLAPWRIFFTKCLHMYYIWWCGVFPVKIPQYILFSFHIASPLECVLFLGILNICDYHSFPKICRQSASFKYMWRCLLSIQKFLYIWSIICNFSMLKLKCSSKDVFVWCSSPSCILAFPDIWCHWQLTFFVRLIVHTKWKPTKGKKKSWSGISSGH